MTNFDVYDPLNKILNNKNLLDKTNFFVSSPRFPLSIFAAQEVTIPDMTLTAAPQSNPFADIPRSGDKIQYAPLDLLLIADEELRGYNELYKWINAVGFPESHNQSNDVPFNNHPTELSVFILTNNKNPFLQFTFHHSIITHLSALSFSTLETEYSEMTYNVTFEYSHFTMEYF